MNAVLASAAVSRRAALCVLLLSAASCAEKQRAADSTAARPSGPAAAPNTTAAVRPESTLAHQDTALIPYYSAIKAYLAQRGAAQRADIPEYNDCERLIVGTHEYGPRACVIALPGLATATSASAFSATDGLLVAVASVVPADPWPDEYLRIGLRPGVNCIALRDSSGHWTSLTWDGDPAHPSDVCQRPSTPSAYRVVPMSDHKPLLATSADAIAPVARFEEAMNWTPLVGIRCADRWCDSRIAGAPPDHAGHEATPEYVAIRQWQIKSWYDEQHIAVAGSGPADIHPKLKASVIPDRHIGDYDNDTPFASCIPAVTIYFEGPPSDKYAGYSHLKRHKNEICIQKFGPTDWRAFLRKGKPDQVVFRVTMVHHGPSDIPPATARWRWRDSDEVVWVRCSDGCCEIELDSII